MSVIYMGGGMQAFRAPGSGGGGPGPSDYLTAENIPNRAEYKRLSTGVYSRGSAHFAAASSQALTIASTPAALQTGAGDYAVGAWVYFDALGANRQIFRDGSANTLMNKQLFYVSGTNAIRCRFDNDAAGNTTVDTAITPSTGVWYFVWCQLDRSANLIGVGLDANAINTGSFAGTARSVAERWAIGAAWTGSAYTAFHDGRIDQFIVFKGTDLDLPAIRAAIYNGGSGRPYSSMSTAEKAAWGLVECWRFDGSGGARTGAHSGIVLADNNGVTKADGAFYADTIDGNQVAAWVDQQTGYVAAQTDLAKRPDFAAAA